MRNNLHEEHDSKSRRFSPGVTYIPRIILSLSLVERKMVSHVRVYFLIGNRTLNEFRMNQIDGWTS